MADLDVIKRISIEAQAKGVAQTAGDLDKLAKAQGGVAVASEEVAKSTGSMEGAFTRLQRRVDPVFRMQQDMARDLKILNQSRQQGLGSMEREAQLQALITQKTSLAMQGSAQLAQAQGKLVQANDNVARSSKASAAGLQQLSFQVNDVFTQLGSGTSLSQTLMQQSGQMYQALSLGTGRAVDGLKDVAGAIGRGTLGAASFIRTGPGVVGTLAAMAIGAGAAAAAWRSLQTDVQNTLDGLGKASGARLYDVNQAGARIDARGQLSQREGIRGVQEMVGTGRIGVEMAEQATMLKPDVAKRLGVSYDEAGKLMAKAFADPARAGLDFAAMLTHVDDRTAQNIKSLQEQGKMLEAQRVIYGLVGEAVDGAYKKAAPFYEKWFDWAGKIASAHVTNVGKGVDTVFTKGSLQDQLLAADKEAANYSRQLAKAVQEPVRGPADQIQFELLTNGLANAKALAAALRKEMDGVADATAKAAREQTAALKSQQVGNVLRQLNPDLDRRKTLGDQNALLQSVKDDPEIAKRLNVSLEELRAQANRTADAVKNFETQAQAAEKDHALAMQQIQARTLGERAAVEGERARLEAMRRTRDENEAAIAADRRRAQVIAETTRALQDAARDSQRDLNLLGKYGYERRRQELENERAKALEQNQLTPSGVPRVSAPAAYATPIAAATVPGGPGAYREVGNFVARGADQVDAMLRDIMKLAAQRSGMTVEAYSGLRHTGTGQHTKGDAMDVRIINPDGKPLANYQDASTFRQYELLAQEAKRVQAEKYPQLDKDFRWGGYFGGPRGKYGAMDQMHFDLGGTAMAGGDWRGGLTQQQRALWPGAASVGMDGLPVSRAPVAAAPVTAAPATPGTTPATLINQTFDNRQKVLDYEAFKGPLEQANRELELQNKLLNEYGTVIGKSSFETAKAAAEQELISRYWRDGIKDVSALKDEISAYGVEAAKYAEKQRMMNEAQKGVADWNSALASSTGGFLTDLAHKTKGIDALRNALLRLGDKAIMGAVEKLFGVGSAGGGVLGSIVGALFGVKSANGNAFGSGGVHYYANGGVVSQATAFPYAGGSKIGIMGEAGDEGIMPLKRNREGKLGVIAQMSAPARQTQNNVSVRGGDVIVQGNAGSAEVEQIKAYVQSENAKMARQIERTIGTTARVNQALYG